MPVRLLRQERFSRNVIPRQPMDHATDSRVSNFETQSKRFEGFPTCRIEGADFNHGRIGQFGLATPSPLGHSSFGYSIRHVLGVRTEKEVRRVDAKRVVSIRAVVADFKPGRDWPIGEFPGNAACHVVDLAVRDNSVAFVVGDARPKPTGISLVNLCPKPIRKISAAMLPCTSKTAKPSSFIRSRRKHEKDDSALLASNLNLWTWRSAFFLDRMILHRYLHCRCRKRAVATAPLHSFYHFCSLASRRIS